MSSRPGAPDAPLPEGGDDNARLHISAITEMPSGQDAELATIFCEMRRASEMSVQQMAQRLATPTETIEALEKGALRALPEWPELTRIVTTYAAQLGLDSRPILRRLEAQLVDNKRAVAPPQTPQTPQTPQVPQTNQSPPAPAAPSPAPASPPSAGAAGLPMPPSANPPPPPSQPIPGPPQPPSPHSPLPQPPGAGAPHVTAPPSSPPPQPQASPPQPQPPQPPPPQPQPPQPPSSQPQSPPPQSPPPQSPSPQSPPQAQPSASASGPEGEVKPKGRAAKLLRALLNWVFLIGFVAALGAGVWYAAKHPRMVWSALDRLPEPMPRFMRSAWNFLRPLDNKPARPQIPDPDNRKSDRLP